MRYEFGGHIEKPAREGSVRGDEAISALQLYGSSLGSGNRGGPD